MPDDPYTLADLARLVDVTPRTIRYYVAQGLLPSPEAAGPATRYGDGHLARLQLIKRLQRDHLPLAEIRARLERMGDEEVVAVLASLDDLDPEPSVERDDTLLYVRSLMRTSHVQPVIHGARAPVDRMAMLADARLVDHLGSAGTDLSEQLEAGPTAAARPAAPGSRACRVERSMLSAGAPSPASQAPAGPGQPAPPPSRSSPPSPAVPRPAAAPSSSTPHPALRKAYMDLRSPGSTRSTWERVSLSPDVEIHVRRPLDRLVNKRVERLLQIARELFEDVS